MKIVLGVLVVVLVVLGGINLTKKDDSSAAINEEASLEETSTSANTSSAPQEEPQAEATEVADNDESAPEKQPENVVKNEKPDPLPTGKNGFLADFDPNKNFGLKKDDRFVIDAKGKALTSIPDGLRIITSNTIPDWDKKMLERLQEGPAYAKGDAVIKKLEKKFLMVNGKTGFPVELAGIKFTAPDGAKMSFNAFVNGANGEMMLFFNTKKNGKTIDPESVGK